MPHNESVSEYANKVYSETKKRLDTKAFPLSSAYMNTTTLDAVEANRLQDMWMKLDSNGPRKEIDRVCREYDACPHSYITQCDSGLAQVLIQGMPTTAHNLPIADAETLAQKHGVQTVLRWNTKGFWFNA